MRLIFKERDIFTVVNFIFDIFSNYSQDQHINNTQIKEVIAVFRKD
jgi:hypothetical protein